jgi:hypothetical protein
MLENKDYCDYDTCVALKELGYDDSTDLRYNSYGSLGDFLGGIKAPTLYEAQKFLREEKDMNVNIRAFVENGWYYTIQDCKGNPICSQLMLTDELYSTYEEALFEGIKEAIKILKGKII